LNVTNKFQVESTDTHTFTQSVGATIV